MRGASSGRERAPRDPAPRSRSRARSLRLSLLFGCQRTARAAAAMNADGAARTRTGLVQDGGVTARLGRLTINVPDCTAMERPAGFEPASSTWQAEILPLDDGRGYTWSLRSGLNRQPPVHET